MKNPLLYFEYTTRICKNHLIWFFSHIWKVTYNHSFLPLKNKNIFQFVHAPNSMDVAIIHNYPQPHPQLPTILYGHAIMGPGQSQSHHNLRINPSTKGLKTTWTNMAQTIFADPLFMWERLRNSPPVEFIICQIYFLEISNANSLLFCILIRAFKRSPKFPVPKSISRVCLAFTVETWIWERIIKKFSLHSFAAVTEGAWKFFPWITRRNGEYMHLMP